MENNRKTLSKRGARLLAVLLAAALAFTLAPAGSPALADGPAYIDLEKACSVTVAPAAEGSDIYDDAMTANVVVDLYRIADAVKVDGYDTYTYAVRDAYAGILASVTDAEAFWNDMTAAGWSEIAQSAAAIALGETPQTPDKSGPADNATAIGELPAGLYLIIAHGSDLDLDEYVDEADGKLVTLAYSTYYKYVFEPQLISLPTKAADDEGVIMTSNEGGWIYDAEVNMKPAQELNMGDLEIEKTLSGYIGSDDAVFVFQIEATMKNKQGEDEVVYSNAVSITFTADGTQSIVLERAIPIGATVVVTEVYSGSRYELSSDGSQTVTISAEEVAKASFSNKHDGTFTGGGGISNRFVYDSTTWQVNPTDEVQ
ncbi:MAG: hypothetical protein IJ594_01070 [Oscillospiraceae bacterium]|nr:hypothetical protein [Oscillospiraceae bacterium]